MSPVLGIRGRITLFIVIVLLTIFLSSLLLTGTGFCYRELRYLSEREILDRYLLGPEWPQMTLQQRQEYLSQVVNYPNCCRVDDRPQGMDFPNLLINALFGKYFFSISTIFPTYARPEHDPYYQIISDIDACGLKRDIDKYEMPESKSTYDSILNSNSEYWRSLGYDDL